MKNENKGELTSENVVSIVISLIVILFLIALASGLFGLFTDKTEKEQAKAVLDRIVRKAELMEEGQETSVLVTAPKDWMIFSHSSQEELCFSKLPDKEENWIPPLGEKWAWESTNLEKLMKWKEDNGGVCVDFDKKFNMDSKFLKFELEEGKPLIRYFIGEDIGDILTNWGFRIEEASRYYITLEKNQYYFRDYSKMNHKKFIDNIMSEDLKREDIEEEIINELREDYEGEIDKKVGIAVDYPNGDVKFFPSKEYVKQNLGGDNKNFVLSEEKEDIGVYIVIEKE